MDKETTKVAYIYESPDGGNTIYRREFGEKERELYKSVSISEESNDTPAVLALTEEEIQSKFDLLRKTLKSTRLRANWTQDYTMSHSIHEAIELLEKLEHDFHTASQASKAAINKVIQDKS